MRIVAASLGSLSLNARRRESQAGRGKIMYVVASHNKHSVMPWPFSLRMSSSISAATGPSRLSNTANLYMLPIVLCIRLFSMLPLCLIEQELPQTIAILYDIWCFTFL